MTPEPQPQTSSSPPATPDRGGATSTGERTYRSAEEWCELLDVRIVDPDGWRGVQAEDVVGGLLAFETAWKQRISREEFDRRYAESTVDPRGRKAAALEQAAGEAAALEAEALRTSGELAPAPIDRDRREHLAQATDLLTLENAIRGGQAGAKVWTCAILTRRHAADAVWLHLAGPCVADVEAGYPSPAYEVPGPDLVDHFQRDGFLRPWKGEDPTREVTATMAARTHAPSRRWRAGAELCDWQSVSDDAPCEYEAGHIGRPGDWRHHRVRSPYGDGRWRDFKDDGTLVSFGGPWDAQEVDRMVTAGAEDRRIRAHHRPSADPVMDEAKRLDFEDAVTRRARLEAAQRALHQVGYWKPEEIGPDVAPRILELGSKLTSLQDELEATQIQLERAVGLAHPDRLTQAELDQLPTIDVSGVNRIAVDVKAQRKAWELEVIRHYLEHLPSDEAQAVDHVHAVATAMIEARP